MELVTIERIEGLFWLETKEAFVNQQIAMIIFYSLQKMEATGSTNHRKESDIQVWRWYGFVLVKAAIKHYVVIFSDIEKDFQYL
ncbi:12309_t:CDS:2 [Gigaspora rosea]|nr:12309_t:CDS:2 [Gigaspora rosea]